MDGSREATIGRTPQRYVWPSELDLMAQLAGFTLESRWADWDCSEFTGASEKPCQRLPLPYTCPVTSIDTSPTDPALTRTALTRTALTLEDASALTALLNRIDAADQLGEPAEEPSIRELLTMPGLDLERDTVAVRADEQITGFTVVDVHTSLDRDGRVRCRADGRRRSCPPPSGRGRRAARLGRGARRAARRRTPPRRVRRHLPCLRRPRPGRGRPGGCPADRRRRCAPAAGGAGLPSGAQLAGDEPGAARRAAAGDRARSGAGDRPRGRRCRGDPSRPPRRLR